MRVLAHDYETTGIKAATCGVVQSAIAIVDIDEQGHHQVVAQETALHHPGEPIPMGASKVHGIYDRHVSHLPHFEESLTNTMAQAAEEFGYDAVLGYNSNRFDNVIARRFGLKPGVKEIDLMTAANRMLRKGRITRARLVDAYEGMTGKPAENAHDAQADIFMTLELIRPIMAEEGLSTFTEFVDWLIRPTIDTNMPMPFGKHKGLPVKVIPTDYLKWLLRKGDLQRDLELSIKEVVNGC